MKERFILVIMLSACGGPEEVGISQDAALVQSIRFFWNTHERAAQGSDNFPITWAADGNQYTSWGDGNGFRGNVRSSLGVARIAGGPPPAVPIEDRAVDLFSGSGKSYGILAVGDTLYLWVSPGSGKQNYEEARLWRSTNGGQSWTRTAVRFTRDDGIIMPVFLQFGRGYAGARDEFVYMYTAELNSTSATRLQVQRPGRIFLMRAPKGQLGTRSAYRFFAGREDNTPVWSASLADAEAVFTDSNGVSWNTGSVSYNAGLERYFLMTEHGASASGNLGVFEARNPWGPWTRVFYTGSFGGQEIAETTFYWNFSNKWLRNGGRDFVLVFTGVESNDSWNTVQGRFEL